MLAPAAAEASLGASVADAESARDAVVVRLRFPSARFVRLIISKNNQKINIQYQN